MRIETPRGSLRVLPPSVTGHGQKYASIPHPRWLCVRGTETPISMDSHITPGHTGLGRVRVRRAGAHRACRATGVGGRQCLLAAYVRSASTTNAGHRTDGHEWHECIDHIVTLAMRDCASVMGRHPLASVHHGIHGTCKNIG